MNTRFLGIICIVGSVIAVLDAFRLSAVGKNYDDLTPITLSLWYIGGIAALVSMIQLNAVGSNTVVRALTFLPIIGFVVLILGSVLQLAGAITAQNNLFSIGWLVLYSGMLLVGILTIAAKVWRGWRRFVPLLTVVAMPISFSIGYGLGSLSLGVSFIYAVWAFFGYVITTSEPTPAPAPAQNALA
jgi:hypothetical protein